MSNEKEIVYCQPCVPSNLLADNHSKKQSSGRTMIQTYPQKDVTPSANRVKGDDTDLFLMACYFGVALILISWLKPLFTKKKRSAWDKKTNSGYMPLHYTTAFKGEGKDSFLATHMTRTGSGATEQKKLCAPPVKSTAAIIRMEN